MLMSYIEQVRRELKKVKGKKALCKLAKELTKSEAKMVFGINRPQGNFIEHKTQSIGDILAKAKPKDA